MKLSDEQLAPLATPEVAELAAIFRRHGYELRVAGGAVRDILSDIVPHDLDFATTATPEQMKELFTKEQVRMINTKGEKHGTITARINDAVNMEVTTLRVDVVTDGRHAEVEFTTDWELDAGRRDLTVNAMFLDLQGVVHDYFNGREDLRQRRVRFVGDPVTRIQEDYLRILRYFRFYGRLATDPDAHDEPTLRAIRENVGGLARISGERIWSELRRIVAGNHHRELTLLMLRLGVLQHAGFPESAHLAEFGRVCDRTAPGTRRQPMTLLAALLRTAEEMLDVHKRLKLSGFERDLGLFIVMHRGDPAHRRPLRSYQHILVDFKGSKAVCKQFIVEVLRYRGEHDLAQAFEAWDLPPFPVSGATLKSAGVPSGRAMSRVMARLKEEWVEADFQLDSEQLSRRIPHLLEEMGVETRT